MTRTHRLLSLFAISFVLLIVYFLHTYNIATTPDGINYDSAHNLAGALRIARGDGLPAMIFDDRPEILHRYLLAGWFTLIGAGEVHARLLHGLLGLLTVALTFRATVDLLHGHRWRVMGGVIAGITIAVAMPHLMLSRTGYRAALLLPCLALTVSLLVRAGRSRHTYLWGMAGFSTGMAINTYFAGLVAPIWAGYWLLYSKFFAPSSQRITWREVGTFGLGFALPLFAWGVVMSYISNLFFRFSAVATDSQASLPVRFINGMVEAVTAFYHDAYDDQVLYNIPNSPYLNPILVILALCGVGFACWHWRERAGLLILGGLALFMLPGAISEEPTHPVRLIGTLPFLAMFAGWGFVDIFSFAERFTFTFSRSSQRVIGFTGMALVIMIGAVSIFSTFDRYHRFFTPATSPDYPAVVGNYAERMVATMELLADVDQPTYVPLSSLNDRIAVLTLLSTHFPHVTTLANMPDLTTLPAGQVFYPTFDYLSSPTPARDLTQALLLPEIDTIVILPLSVGEIVKRVEGAEVITNAFGTEIAFVYPREQTPLPPMTIQEGTPILGEHLRSTLPHTIISAQEGDIIDVALEWQVTGTFNRSVFTFVQMLGEEQTARASSDQQVLEYIYPSTRWQVGDVIPDVHTNIQLPFLPQSAYRWVAGAWANPVGQDYYSLTSSDGVPLGNLLYWGALRPLTNAELSSVIPPDDVTMLDARLGDDIMLEACSTTSDDDVLSLTLYWQALTPQSMDYTVFVHVMQGDTIQLQQDARPDLPTWAWREGERFRTNYTFNTTDVAWDGLFAGMYSFPSLTRLPITVDGDVIGDRVDLSACFSR